MKLYLNEVSHLINALKLIHVQQQQQQDHQSIDHGRRLVVLHLRRLFLFQLTIFVACLFSLVYYVYVIGGNEYIHVWKHDHWKRISTNCKIWDVIWFWQLFVSVLMAIVILLSINCSWCIMLKTIRDESHILTQC